MTTEQMDRVGGHTRRVPITSSAAIRSSGWQLTMADIRALAAISQVPDSAIVTVRNEPGDQREGTSGSYVLQTTWSS
jgi:hypothetical protein